MVSLSAGATDPDGDGLTFGAVGLPVGLGIDSLTGVVTGTVSFGAAGVYPVVVTVTDDVSRICRRRTRLCGRSRIRIVLRCSNTPAAQLRSKEHHSF